jgi:hypothetical protein
VIFRGPAALIGAWLAVTARLRSWAARPTRPRDWWRALPGDLLGRTVMLGLGIRGHNRVHEAGGVRAFVVEDERIDRYFRIHLIPTRAQTLGHYVLARGPLDAETMAHECEHIRQWEWLGPLYLPAYFVSSAFVFLRGRRPYWDNHFEAAARVRAQRDTASDLDQPAVERDAT